MKTSHANNLRDNCRACLSSRQKSYNLNTISSDLKEFLDFLLSSKLFLPINLSPEDYPQFLCDVCFQRLQDFFEFRNQIYETSKRIQKILQSQVESDDDDNKLLLPELADWNVGQIKSEAIEFEEPGEPEETYNLQTEIKTEIDFEFEPDDSNSCDLDAFSDVDAQQTSKTYRKRDRSKKSFKCPRCNKHAYKKIYLDAHIRKIHEGLEKPFLCSVSECQKAFTRYNQLHVHFQTNHTLNIKFECDIAGCNKSFRLGQTLESHKRTFHKSKNLKSMKLEQVIVKHQEQTNSEFENECQVCSKKYSSKRALLEHLRRHNNDKRHFCNVCGVGKVTKTELMTHLRTHDNNLEKFRCSLCPQQFNHKNAISRHVRVVHEGERRFSCSFCPRRFGTKNSQVCHERLHTGEKPFQCILCEKGFAQVEGLKSHMKNHNKFLRKHICQYCEARFITRKNLLDHEQRHKSDKPFICRTCSRGFPRREDLDFHLKEYHGDLNDEDSTNFGMKEKNSSITSENTSEYNAEKSDELDRIDEQQVHERDPLNDYNNEHILS